MSEQPKSAAPATNDKPEYAKPEVEVLGSLVEMTEGAATATSDVGALGSL